MNEIMVGLYCFPRASPVSDYGKEIITKKHIPKQCNYLYVCARGYILNLNIYELEVNEDNQSTGG